MLFTYRPWEREDGASLSCILAPRTEPDRQQELKKHLMEGEASAREEAEIWRTLGVLRLFLPTPRHTRTFRGPPPQRRDTGKPCTVVPTHHSPLHPACLYFPSMHAGLRRRGVTVSWREGHVFLGHKEFSPIANHL